MLGQHQAHFHMLDHQMHRNTQCHRTAVLTQQPTSQTRQIQHSRQNWIHFNSVVPINHVPDLCYNLKTNLWKYSPYTVSYYKLGSDPYRLHWNSLHSAPHQHAVLLLTAFLCSSLSFNTVCFPSLCHEREQVWYAQESHQTCT